MSEFRKYIPRQVRYGLGVFAVAVPLTACQPHEIRVPPPEQTVVALQSLQILDAKQQPYERLLSSKELIDCIANRVCILTYYQIGGKQPAQEVGLTWAGTGGSVEIRKTDKVNIERDVPPWVLVNSGDINNEPVVMTTLQNLTYRRIDDPTETRAQSSYPRIFVGYRRGILTDIPRVQDDQEMAQFIEREAKLLERYTTNRQGMYPPSFP